MTEPIRHSNQEFLMADRQSADTYDPGPVPPEPQRRSTTVRAGGRASVTVTRNVGYTGRTGLTVTRDGLAAITVALPPDVVDALVWLLHTTNGVSYASTRRPESPPEAGEVWQ